MILALWGAAKLEMAHFAPALGTLGTPIALLTLYFGKFLLNSVSGRTRLRPVLRSMGSKEGYSTMSKSFVIRLSAAALVAGSVMGAAGFAAAQDQTAIYSQYHQAIRAAETCREMTLDPAAWSKASTYIDKKINYEIPAGQRLTLIEAAKSDTRVLIWNMGCDSDEVKALLGLYDAELANPM